jgi:hypothetical protein
MSVLANLEGLSGDTLAAPEQCHDHREHGENPLPYYIKLSKFIMDL